MNKNMALSLLRKYCQGATNVDIDLTDAEDFQNVNSKVLHDGCKYRSLKIREGYRSESMLNDTCKPLYTTDTSVSDITANSKCLKTLHLLNCSELTNAALSAIAINAKMLEELVLEDVYHLNNSGLIEVAQGCPALRTLAVKLSKQSFEEPFVGVSPIGDSTLQAIAELCKDFESLTLNGPYIDVSDDGMDNLAEKCGSKLKCVQIESNDKITSKTVESLAAHCNNVAALALQSIMLKITDSLLHKINTTWPNIKVLHLWNCDDISQNAIDAFASTEHSELEELMVTNFNLNGAALEQLFLQNPKIQTLFIQNHTNSISSDSFTKTLVGLADKNSSLINLDILFSKLSLTKEQMQELATAYKRINLSLCKGSIVTHTDIIDLKKQFPKLNISCW
ncbi:MAG: hypothetical protein JSR46_03965 [Verrucomicrobia bacterium]|nr:hypothetical protein [Verrucomicrobiota bacterium]